PVQSYDLAFGPRGFVAVGSAFDRDAGIWRDAVSVTGGNGSGWSAPEWLPSASRLRAIAQAEAAPVIAGGNGTLLRSADGYEWQSPASGTNATLTSVAFAGPRGIAAGSGTVLWSETAGQTWEDRSPALLPTGFSERAFAAGSQLFLAGD